VPSDRVDLEDCENMSRELSAVLDVEDPIPQAFQPRGQLARHRPAAAAPRRTSGNFAGSEAKIQLAIPLQLESGERKNFKGILRASTNPARSSSSATAARFTSRSTISTTPSWSRTGTPS